MIVQKEGGVARRACADAWAGVGYASVCSRVQRAGSQGGDRLAPAAAGAMPSRGGGPGYGCATSSPTISASAVRSANASTSGHHSQKTAAARVWHPVPVRPGLVEEELQAEAMRVELGGNGSLSTANDITGKDGG